MECKEFESLIPAYFEETLEDNELEEFIAHIESCKECKEEVTIRYMITEGLQRLEDGEAFDMQKELNQKLASSVRRIHLRKRIQIVFYIIEAVSIVAILGCLYYILK